MDIDIERADSEELEKLLKPKQRRFVWEYEMDWNGTRAAIRAGYGEKGAAVTASRLLKNANVAAYMRARQREQYAAMNINRETLSMKMQKVFEQCMEGTPHLVWDSETKEYVPDGTFVFDSKGANSALKMLGDSIGMFEQRVQHSGNIGIEEFLSSIPDEAADEF